MDKMPQQEASPATERIMESIDLVVKRDSTDVESTGYGMGYDESIDVQSPSLPHEATKAASSKQLSSDEVQKIASSKAPTNTGNTINTSQ